MYWLVKSFALYLQPQNWSCGRVARQSSAKAPTAVRIRSGPLLKGYHTIAFFVGVDGIKFLYFKSYKVMVLISKIKFLRSDTFTLQKMPKTTVALLKTSCYGKRKTTKRK